MDDSGWKLIKSNNNSFLVRRIYSEENFKVLLTDHRRLWSAEGTASELLHMSQKENPLCEFELSKVTKNLFNLFDKSLDSLSVDGNDEKLRTMKMSSSLGNRPFSLVWTVFDQGPDALYNEVTRPLLHFAEEMGRRHNHLCDELHRKECEINEHVLENGPLKWHQIKTEKFNREEFNKDFMYYDPSDLIEAAWEKSEMLAILNKNTLVSKRREETPVDRESPQQNLIIKQEETACENVSVVPPYLEVTQVKKETQDEPLSSTSTRLKRKKVKLNL